jgi:hypothetical protein
MCVLREEQRLKPTLLECLAQFDWANSLVGNESQYTDTHASSRRHRYLDLRTAY